MSVKQGVIKRFFADRGFGFIGPEAGGQDVFFHINNARGMGREPEIGQRVVYEERAGPKGPEAVNVHPSGASATRPDTGGPHTPGVRSGEYRFLNPYNFVRSPGPPRRLPSDAGAELLGRCPPPPHDRWVGLTGTITCELEAVTPLFISDPASYYGNKKDEEADHRTYRFFQYDGHDVIPATSLRGSVRSVFEAVTNSCYSVFTGERLSYRLEPGVAATLVPARVEKKPDGTWHLRLLPGFAPLNPGDRPRALYAATVRRYDPVEPPRSSRSGSRPPRKIDLKGLRHGELCYARVEKRGIFTYVYELARTASELAVNKRDTEEIVQGWLCINNQNIEPKSKERVFFRDGHNSSEPVFVDLDPKVARAYEDLIKDYQTRHEDEVRARRQRGQPVDRLGGAGRGATLAFSRYIYDQQDLKLNDGTLVYARLRRDKSDIVVDSIAPAAVPRVSYHHSVDDLLPSHLRPCSDYDALCPACRSFGWVYALAKGEKIPQDKPVAYAGRLRFSHAVLTPDGDKGTLEDITLAILSSPKPTTTRFYLRPRVGQPRSGMSDADAGYDGDNVLRGRKFYRHHGTANSGEYERATVEGFDGKDDQNRTVRGARKPGNKFTFTVDFENLALVEFGALLWSLELEGKGYHRLGFAKPLGFGSARIRVTALEWMSPSERYGELEATGDVPDALSHKASWIEKFKDSMSALYRQPFDTLPNVRDLAALLGEPPALSIHYPRVDATPSPEGKNFEWFVGNKRSGRDAGPRLVLTLAEEDTEGLPLLDKFGRFRGR